MTPENCDDRPLRWAMVWKFSAMSALPLTRPDALTFETKPSMMAPLILRRSADRHRKTVAVTRGLGTQILIKRRDQPGAGRDDEITRPRCVSDPVPTRGRIHVPLRVGPTTLR